MSNVILPTTSIVSADIQAKTGVVALGMPGAPLSILEVLSGAADEAVTFDNWRDWLKQLAAFVVS